MKLLHATRVLITFFLLLSFCSLVSWSAPQTQVQSSIPALQPKTPKQIAAAQSDLYAALVGNVGQQSYDRVLQSLKNGASVNRRFDDSDQTTPLIQATRFGHLRALKLFLKLGARINDTDNRKRTALWHAAQGNRLDTDDIGLIRLLLTHGSQIDFADDNGVTPLGESVFSEQKEIAEYLLKSKAGPNHRDQFGKTPLEWASYNGLTDLVAILQNYAGASTRLPNARQKKLDIALMHACEREDVAAIHRLIYLGADVNSHLKDWTILSEKPYLAAFEMMEFSTPLLVSADSIAVTQALLQAGAVPDAHDENHTTPLMITSSRVAELLISAGANVNARDSQASTPLMHRVAKKDADAVTVLLNHQANIQARDAGGSTAVMITHDEKILNLLLKHGGDINARDNWGRTALINAADSTWFEGVYPFCDAPWARVLLRNGANPNIRDNNGNTALMLLAAQGEYGYFGKGDPIVLAKYLLGRGARLDVKNKNGRTALQIAQHSGAKTLTNLFHASSGNIPA